MAINGMIHIPISDYEKDKTVLDKIKELLPNAYICNLDGKK